MDKVAYTKKEALGLLPWGRDTLEVHLEDGTCPSFWVGKRRFIARDDLQEYIRNLKEQSA